MALEAREDELNIFERLYSPAAKEEKKHWVYSLKAACAIAVVMLVLSVVVSYAIDVASSGAIEKRLKTSGSEADINLLMQRQKLIKAVAQERPDLLDLLGQVTASGDRGIKLESFHFKKGQPVTITGQASTNEQLYKFEKSLQDRKNIKSVKMNPSRDTKTKKSKFTITFHYRNFTK
jgi:Tfp pilus assembly protein PilN